MFKMLALIAVVAAVNAETLQVSSRDNDMRITRSQETSFFEMSTAVAALRAQVEMLASGASPLTLGVRAIADDMTARTTDIVANQASFNIQMSNYDLRLSTITGVIGVMQDTFSSQLAAAAAEASRAAVAVEEAAAQHAAQMQETMEVTLANITASVNVSLSAMNTTVQTVASNLATGLASKADAVKKMWSGGCSESPGGGWRTYCLDRILYDRTGGHFRKSSHTEFQAIRSYMFIRLTMFTITHGSGWNHMQYELNGNSIYYTYSHTAGCWWKDMHGDLIFAVTTNDKWRVKMHGACSHAFHPGGRIGDHHSRVTVFYEGPSG